MSVTALIDRIKPHASGWGRTGTRIKAGIAIKPYIVKDRIKLLREQMDRYDGFYRGCTNPKLLLRYPDFSEQ